MLPILLTMWYGKIFALQDQYRNHNLITVMQRIIHVYIVLFFARSKHVQWTRATKRESRQTCCSSCTALSLDILAKSMEIVNANMLIMLYKVGSEVWVSAMINGQLTLPANAWTLQIKQKRTRA